jgi:hypothetical protein
MDEQAGSNENFSHFPGKNECSAALIRVSRFAFQNQVGILKANGA